MSVQDDLSRLIRPAIEAMGFEFVGLEYLSNPKNRLVRIYIDREPEGISIDDCADVSNEVSGVLDVEDPIEDMYTLEVSSPDIDRPLTRLKDFEVWDGYEAKIETTEMIDGRRRFKGKLAGIADGEVLVEIEEKGELIIIGLAFDWLSDAKLVLTDELISEMLKARKEAGVLNESAFDSIEQDTAPQEEEN